MNTKQDLAYGEKLRRCNKEALVTVGALALTVIVWIVCGFGLSGLSVKIAGIPLWAVCGTVGTWIFAIIVSVVLSRAFFKDFDVEEEGE